MLTKGKLRQKRGAEGMMEALRAPGLVRVSEGIVRMLLGAVLAGADLPGGYAPFGAAFVGASGSGIEGLCALIGAVFGSFCFRGMEDGLRDMAAAVLIFSVAFAFFDVKLYKKSWFMPAVTALMVGATGFVSLPVGWLRTSGVACYLTATLLAGGAAYFDRVALSVREVPKGEELTHRQRVSLLLFGGTILMSLARVTLLDELSVGCVLAGLVVLCAGNLGGLGAGAAAGVCAGLAMDLAKGAPLYSLALGFAGLFAGAFRRQGRLFGALAYVLADGVVALWLWESTRGAAALLYETFVVSVIFVTLPEGLFHRLAARMEPNAAPEGEARRRAFVREKLEGTAEAFRSVYENLRGSFTPERGNGENPAVVYRRAADKVCVRCALRDACWEREYESTVRAMNDGLPAMLERGRGKAADLPQWFSARCIRLPNLLEAMDEEISALLLRRRYQNRLRENRAAVCRQYGQLAQVLEEAALELGAELTPEPVRERRLRHYLAARGLEGEGTVFLDQRGRRPPAGRDPSPGTGPVDEGGGPEGFVRPAGGPSSLCRPADREGEEPGGLHPGGAFGGHCRGSGQKAGWRDSERGRRGLVQGGGRGALPPPLRRDGERP